MRQGQQHRRGRGRNNNNNNVNNHPGNRSKGQNPLTRSFESNGPDVKVRGTPAHIAEKYLQLARDAQSTGDYVLAENYLQHAEHYNRIILAYREQQMQQSGEQMNGGGRPHQQGHRHDMGDGDEGAGDDTMGNDDQGGSSDQPVLVRHPGAEQPGGDMQPSFGEARPQHQQRHDQHPRYRDRQMRHERTDRPEGGYDRGGERHGQERQGQERQGERGFDRNRERPYRQHDQGGEGRDVRLPREPREFREPREPREPREYREQREPRQQSHEVSRDIPRDVAPVNPPPVEAPSIPPMPPVVDEVAAAPVRPEGGPRRRERFGLGADQPEFLRRPVRRPRREVEQEFAPDAPPAPVLPPADEPPRE